jgi:D-proline reductase (dithiol) PrdB
VGLVSQAIESRNVPTVTLAMERSVEAPRVVFVPFPYNYPMGAPEDAERHREVALSALAVLHTLRSSGEVALPFEWRKKPVAER